MSDYSSHNLMLLREKVRLFWGVDLLKKSLGGFEPIALDMQGPNGQPAPPIHQVARAFNEPGQAMLIFGGPGSGKTTTLMQLTTAFIEQAESNVNAPIPVVFNLTSWVEKHGQLFEWLQSEFDAHYQIPRKLFPNWLRKGELILMLDGLNEMRAEHRNKCIQAIRDFHVEYNLTSLVVCGNTQHYAQLTACLKPANVLLIKPLSDAQIESYLAARSEQSARLVQILKANSELREMAGSPLLLHIISVAYQDAGDEYLTTIQNNKHLKHVFSAYVVQALKRPSHSGDKRYSDTEAIRWLSWLAQRMTQLGVSMFLPERLHVGWLKTNSQRWLYRMIVGLFYFLIAGVLYKLFGNLVRLPYGGSTLGVFTNLFYFSGAVIMTGLQLAIITGLLWRWSGGARATQTKHPLKFASKIPEALRITISTGVVFGGAAWIYPMSVGDMFRMVGMISSGNPANPILEMVRWASCGIYVGILGLLVFGLYFGGHLVIRYFTLLNILVLMGYVPRRYSDFLEHAADLGFLRKIGGGYTFAHRVLRDYFAGLESPPGK